MEYNSLYKSVVKAIKSKEELASVTCIYGNRREISQNPVCGFTLSFEAVKSKYENSTESSARKATTEVKLCLLAPSGAGGKRLAEVAHWIAEALRESEIFTENSEITIGAPEFNESLATLYLDINIVIYSEMLTAAESKVSVNGEVVKGLTAFSAQSEELIEKTGELLNGYTVKSTLYYVIDLSADTPLVLPEESFDIELVSEDRAEVYSGCALGWIKRELKAGKILYNYRFTAKELSEYGSVN